MTRPTPLQPRIVIIGGGLAGMAAAAALTQLTGCRITLLEARPRLGGRASSFVDQATGSTIDNCQHVNLGCCTNFQHFCQTTQLEAGFRTEPSMTFIGHNGRRHSLAASCLPAPLHLLPSFARLSYLTWYDKWRLAWGLRALAHRRHQASRESMGRWLQRHHQTPRTVDRVWQVVLVSALSESLDRIAVHDARKVFVDAFLANRHGWELQIPTMPLDTLYTDRVGTWLKERGVDLRIGSGVARMEFDQQVATTAILRSGEETRGDEFVLAVPGYLLGSLLPEARHPDVGVGQIEQLEWAPISSVHLWFDRPIMDLPHAVLIDRLSQWVFARNTSPASARPDSDTTGSVAASGAAGAGTAASIETTGSTETAGQVADRYYYQVVISASRELDGREQSAIIEDVLTDLRETFPETRQAMLLRARVVTEHKACLSMLPSSTDHRPLQETGLTNVTLAGDWTRTGWPSTMEGAVRSGYLAAEAIARKMGRKMDFVQPDLPVSRLAQLLMRL